MTRKALVASILALLFAAAVPSAAFAQDPALKRFLDEIYAPYSKPNSPGTSIDTRAKLDRYFTPALARLIDRDAQRAKMKNEPPDLNGDPFIDAQDWEITDLETEIQPRGKNRVLAIVSYKNSGENRQVRLDVVKTVAGWRIDNIHWWRDGSLRDLYKKR
jgi:hypothetical protein